MSFWDKLFGEFVDVIEWTDSTNNTMVYRFDRLGNEIKYAAKLTVREGQVAVFVNEGQIADVFEPGMYELETNNLPILTTIQNWPHGFESPFKAEVYFFNTKQFTDLKWGTKNPLIVRDPEFAAARLRAYGTYAIRVKDAVAFLKEVVGTDGRFTTDEITNQLRNLIVSHFSSIVGESGIPLLDLAANYDDLSNFITEKIKPEFEEYGIEVTTLLVENISLPPEVEKALDKRTSMGITGDLKKYMDYQTAEAMEAAAKNPSGGGSEGIGMGMGIAVAKSMTDSVLGSSSHSPPPVPTEKIYYIAVNGHQTGPFVIAEMRNKAASGQLTRDSLVWSPGITEWQAAKKLDDLDDVFQTPPPLPASN